MASDNFNRANESPLASPWASDSVFGGLNLVSNTVRTPVNSDRVSYHTGSQAGYSHIEVNGQGGGSPAIHCDGAGSGYSAVLDVSGERVGLWLAEAGDFTSIGDDAWTPGSFTSMTLFRDGNDVVVHVDGVEVIRRTNTALTGGFDGIQAWDTSWQGDNWTNGQADAVVAQAGFRFYNDDGDEDGSTAAAAQDANLTTATAVNKIFRALLQASGDPASKTLTLRSQKNGTGGYVPLAVGSPATGTINNQPVAAGADDAQQSGSTMTVTGTTIGASLDATTEYVGIRFGSVNIPKGATITTAYMRVVPSGTGEDEPLVTIAGLDEDNAAAFTTTANDITSRAITTATASWSSTDLGASGSSYHNTPSLVSIVQEIIDRAGWASGNAIGFRIQGGATTTRDLTIESYENTGNNPPQLYVEYSYSPEVFISASSYIAAGGEDTTQRLTGGTGSFTTGRIWDDENGSDSIDIGSDDNTEIAWCVQLASGLADGTYFDFKVFDGSAELDGTAARWTVAAGGGAVELEVDDATHGHAVDSPSLTQANTLDLGGSFHGLVSAEVALTQANVLVAVDSAHGQASDSPVLSQSISLGVGGSSHGHIAGGIDLTQANTLALAGAAHVHIADGISLTQAIAIAVADCVHGLSVDGVTMVQGYFLQVGDSAHLHISDGLELTQANILAIGSAVHAHTADSADMSTADFLSVDSSAHEQMAEGAELVQASILTIGDSAHSLVSAEILLSQSTILEIGEAVHAMVADGVTVSHDAVLAVASAVHLHAANEIYPTQAATIVVSDSVHALVSQQINLLMPGGLGVPPGRTIVVQAQQRVIVIQPESRIYRVH